MSSSMNHHHPVSTIITKYVQSSSTCNRSQSHASTCAFTCTLIPLYIPLVHLLIHIYTHPYAHHCTLYTVYNFTYYCTYINILLYTTVHILVHFNIVYTDTCTHYNILCLYIPCHKFYVHILYTHLSCLLYIH